MRLLAVKAETTKRRNGETGRRSLSEVEGGRECNSGVEPHSGGILVARGGAKRNPW